MEVEGRNESLRIASETKVDPVLVGLGLIALFLAIAAAPFAAGIPGSFTIISSAYSAILIIPFVVTCLILLGGAFLVARVLWYPLQSLPSDERLLRGPTRRQATLASRVGEIGSWILTAGAGLLVMGFLVGIPALQGTWCMDGPCTGSVVSPAIPAALYVFGIVAICLGGIIILVRTTLRRPSRGHKAAIGAP